MSNSLSRWIASALMLLGAATSLWAAAPAQPETPVPEMSMPNPFLQPPPPAAVAPTTVVAVVESQKILQSDINAMVDRVLKASGDRIPAEQMAMARAQLSANVLENLIMQKLLTREVEKAKIVVTSNDLAQAKQEIPLPPGMTFEQALEAQGMTAQDFENMVRIKNLLDQKTAAVAAVTEADLKKYYDENKSRFEQPETVTARHILIAVPEKAEAKVKAEKKAQAEALRQQLLKGGDFAALAKQHSEDPGSKDKGGEYTFPRGQMMPAFEQAAFSNDLNKIGPLVETDFGYHILQTTAKHPAKTVPLAEASDRLRQFLTGQAKREVVEKYLKQLRAAAKVEIPGQK
ncbi:MAG: peptidylprolyl isomerase [Kiritimatiellaeota bacterium]|nr:peptidylprolyl isomerase [Kiritimatiellota bacterium]